MRYPFGILAVPRTTPRGSINVTVAASLDQCTPISNGIILDRFSTPVYSLLTTQIGRVSFLEEHPCLLLKTAAQGYNQRGGTKCSLFPAWSSGGALSRDTERRSSMMIVVAGPGLLSSIDISE